MKRTLTHILATTVVATALMTAAVTAAAQTDEVRINDQVMTPEMLSRLFAMLGAPADTEIRPGHYWYDAFSGLWGEMGGPTQGQILPGLQLGGMLRADASGQTGTGVFINGRQLHATEVETLRSLFGVVYPGRYWMNAMGIGGFEGGPATFDVGAAVRRQQQQGGENHLRRGLFGNTGGDGDTFYYMDPETGSSVMIGG